MESLPVLFPEMFFEFFVEAHKAEKIPNGKGRKKFILPDVSTILGEQSFADLYLSWNERGITVICTSKMPFTDSFYPKFQEGDCLELFIDTRNLKEAGSIHKFCHHFLILPVEVKGIRALEITQFRGEMTHPLADPSLLFVETSFTKKGYELSIHISQEALYGYDPQLVPKLGFAYRLRRTKDAAQHFPISSRVCAIERFPALWATVDLLGNRTLS